MSAIRLRKPLFSRETLRRIRLLGAAGWVAGCADLIGLSDYSESDDPVRHTSAGDGAAGSAFAGEAGAPSEGGESSGGRPVATGGRPPTTGGKLNATGGRAPLEGGEGPGPAPTGGQRASGGRRGLGGEPATGGAENTGGAPPSSGGNPATGGAPTTSSGGAAPVTGGAPATGGSGTGGAGATSCALPAYPAGCRSCIDTSCDSSCDPCLADADCRALVTCAAGCFSNSCLDGCFAAHPDSEEALIDVYDSCAFSTCASTCGARFGASCDEDEDCASGTCSGPDGYCSYLCDSHEDCPLEGWCAADIDGIPRCLLDCSASESDCPTGHHCGYVSTLYDFAIPLCTSLSALSESCTSDDECHGFWCTGSTESQGWCSNPCVDNLSCAIDASCVPDSFGDPLCLVNCYEDADCGPFPGSACSAELDLEDNAVDVCWL